MSSIYRIIYSWKHLLLYSGVGYAVAELMISQLADKRPMRICFACRNMDKAEQARQQLLNKYPYMTIDLLEVDISKPASAIAAAQEIKRRFIFYFNLSKPSE